mgnify:CR=1 FL=1
MTQIKNYDATSARGERTVGVCIADPNAVALVKGFDFNDKATLGSVIFAPFTVDVGSGKIDFAALQCTTRDGSVITLTKKEMMLLKLLIENKSEVVTREKILQAVWGYNVYPTTRTIDNFILNFRKYFEEDSRNPKFFHSVRGIGYKFTE